MKTVGRIIKNLLILLLVLLVIVFLLIYGIMYLSVEKFPLRYGDTINKYAEENGVSPYLVTSIIKTESDFRERIIADDKGMGLMQLMPETAKWLCEKLHEEYNEEKLLEADYNIKLGSYYLSYLIQKYQNVDLAIAAYNGGTKNVDQWLKDGTIHWDPQSMENIPFPVTRTYVKRVRQRRTIYETLYYDGLPDASHQENKFVEAGKRMIKWGKWIYRSI